MKNTITLIIAFLITISSLAQQGINYKALIKDDLGNILVSQTIGVQFQIREATANGSAVYTETHTPTTDVNGIIIVTIGSGTTTDVFADIDWSADDHFLNVQIDTGSGLTDMGTTQFMTVPYALSAANTATKIADLDDGKSDVNGSSIFLGLDAGAQDNGTSNRNVGVGYQALSSNTAGEGNVALGYRAGYNETGSNKLYIANTDTNTPLIHGDFDTNLLTVNGDIDITGNMRLNHSGPQIGAASFTLTQPSEGYGGMYVNSLGTNAAIPFYGYAVGNAGKSWHYYNGIENFWGLYVEGDKLKVSPDSTHVLNNLVAKTTLKVNEGAILNGDVTINTNTQLNQYTDLTIKSTKVNTFGGMYIDVDGGLYSKPFYGYSVNGVPAAYTFYNQTTSSWGININNALYNTMEVKSQNVYINGTLKLGHTNGAAEDNGTIFYFDGHFYGKTPGGLTQLDNVVNGSTSSSSRTSNETNDTIQMLKEENESLKKELGEIKKHLQELDKKVLSWNNE
ncbi:hypothetical protein [Xanthomarina sp. GH4-25]|uniref:hypothetical protein n=1 Tax=Xanthomarina sp. GH4-25 TaxID=3349335 RepID=UPI003877DA6A